MAGEAAPPHPEIAVVIEPGRGGLRGVGRECWQAREILFFLAWRDIKVRYKQTLLGVAWAVLQPVATMVVFTLVFHRLAGLRGGATPYPVFALAGLLPWLLFQSALLLASESLVLESRIITKVYFPRLLVPLSAVGSALVDFACSLVVLVWMLAHYGVSPGRAVLLAPFFVGLAAAAAVAAGLWLSALNARYRDVRYTVPFLVRTLMFLTPVAYAGEKLLSQLPAGWSWIYYLNPLAAAIDGFRWALLNEPAPPALALAAAVVMVAATFAGGLLYFRRAERTLVDTL